MTHTLQKYPDASFITLTYAPEHCPKGYTLVKKDLQKFWKRVRKNLQKFDIHVKIKYYSCGEYGSIRHRPHYHCIIFGLDVLAYREHHDIIADSWKFGYIDYGTTGVNKDSIAYVTDYIHKKLIGKSADEYYTSTGREPPFQCCSLGMGLDFALENEELLKNTLCIRYNGVRNKIPRYYRKKLGITEEYYYDLIEKHENEVREIHAERASHFTGLAKNNILKSKRLSLEAYGKDISLKNQRLKRDFDYEEE